ncbi:hypothetical protein L1286_11615 [Pseudoalteromonas sp. SMS1]|uniref:hypothetical protein n=1 Tax=Pseudoalteromonas sp. SMS1 TaxID=2908894 RepID=UPI001F409BC1|nr:hypothetical protein [Pseudoalteromonas sp. SMS1]MCF2858122.1 hypothetical protein [Pseudoalteromonas sp. SMS1]
MINKCFIFASVCCFFAALLHVGCIIFGPDWYLFLGAGQQMASMAEAGLIEPTIITSMIAIILTMWGFYGLSGAGVIVQLPFQNPALGLIACVLIFRGLSFPLLMPKFPENSLTFWVVSSAICLVMGISFALGIWLKVKNTRT